MGEHNALGQEGERLAAEHLVKNGYTICYRNYRYLKAEIDIIAQKDTVLAIVEVRSRSSDFIEHIAETVTQKKINLLVQAADHYVTDKDLDVEVRFDIITILKNGRGVTLEHLEDAFYHF